MFKRQTALKFATLFIATSPLIYIGKAHAQASIRLTHATPYSQTINKVSATTQLRFTVKLVNNGAAPPTDAQYFFHIYKDGQPDVILTTAGCLIIGTGCSVGNLVSTDPIPSDDTSPSATKTFQVSIPGNLDSGRYRVGMGIYTPATPTKSETRLNLSATIPVTDTDSIKKANAFRPLEPTYVYETPPNSKRYEIGSIFITAKTIVRLPSCESELAATNFANLKAATQNLTSGQVLLLPVGTCKYGSTSNLGEVAMILHNKVNVSIAGHGTPSTKLIARHDSGSTNIASALFITGNSNNVVIRDFSILGGDSVEKDQVGSANRSSAAMSTGIFVEKSTDVTVEHMRIERVRNAGIIAYGAITPTMKNNFIRYSMSDGIHMTHGTTNGKIHYNTAADTGDDAFSSIGYSWQKSNEAPLQNSNISIVGNSATFNKTALPGQSSIHGSGIAFEGTNGTITRQVINNIPHDTYNSIISGNRLQGTGHAGIRIGSVNGGDDFRTGPVSNLKVESNTLTDTKQRESTASAPNEWGAIHVTADAASLSGIKISGNTVIISESSESKAKDAFRFQGNINTSPINAITDSVVESNFVDIQASNYTLMTRCTRRINRTTVTGVSVGNAATANKMKRSGITAACPNDSAFE